ncbi:MAG TPA: sulfite exporter TauE/SafE family protein, partial [Terriglobia bacterium]|nr:sulfite exporter TauE/SafE family protein [Terriglobia bacterium]
NVDVKMGGLLLAGGWAGAGLGVEGIKILRALGEADLVIKLAYVLVLGSLGCYMFLQSLKTLRRGAVVVKSGRIPKGDGLLQRLPWQMDFPRSRVRHSVFVPLLFAGLVGVLASVMGVGGGFIMLPMMVYLLGMPTHVAVGTSLFQILFLCAGVTYMQAAMNQTVDLVLVLPLALGSAVGAQIGARMSRLLRGEQLMILLATLVLAVTGKVATSLVVKPADFLKPAEVTIREKVARSSANSLPSDSPAAQV